MVRNFPQHFVFDKQDCYIGALTVKEVEQVTFGACNENSLSRVKKSASFQSPEGEYVSNGEKLPDEFFWPKVYRMTFLDSTEESELSFSASLKEGKNVASLIVDQFKVDVSEHFESLFLLHRYLHIAKVDIEVMDYWYFQSLVSTVKKQIKKDDDNRKNGQGLGSN